MKNVDEIVAELIKAKKEQIEKLLKKLDEYKQTKDKIAKLEGKLSEIESEVKALYTVDVEQILTEEFKAVLNDILRKQRMRSGTGTAPARRRTIVYEGYEYKSPSYFFKKFGITGGVEGLKAWAQSQGKSIQITEDKIMIL